MEQFEVKVKYMKEQDDGKYKKVTEQYLLTSAKSFTEAETLINNLILKEAKGVKEVVSITRRDYEYVLHTKKTIEWYKCNSSVTTIDPDTDKARTVKNKYLIKANSVEEATKELHSFIGDNLNKDDEIDVSGVNRTNITGVLEDEVIDMEMEMEMDKDLEKEKS